MNENRPVLNIVFLYTELAGYVLTCLEALGTKDNIRLTVLHWPVKSEAPFELPTEGPVHLVSRSNMSREDIASRVAEISPDGIFVSGWMDEDYLAIARTFVSQIPVVLTMDNKWTGSFKQRLVALSSPLFIQRHFNLVWVPGEEQRKYARKMGFQDSNIFAGFYSADTHRFNKIYTKRKESKNINKKLLYIGRYVDQKGLELLWDAFLSLHQDNPKWELHCVGAGDRFEYRVKHPNVFHHGFLQPSELEPLILEATAFVMPSLLEPWGVVLHEMAAAGLPLITSDAVGAANTFVEGNVNGWIYSSLQQKELANSLKNLYALRDDELFQMGNESHRISQCISPDIWAGIGENIVVLNQKSSK
jgi:glycosyltransferase involved in cell wall biosynthesis